MFRPLLLLVMSINFISGLALKVIACDWDLNPSVLLLTSYNAAQDEESTDHMIYKKLQNIYGSKAVSATFSYQDDNSYAVILRNLIETYHLKKVFILDPTFVTYLPSSSDNPKKSSNLIRILQQFTNVKFYFFNNQIANNIKISSNIFEFRLNTANQSNREPEVYGKQIASYFHNKLIIQDGPPGKGQIDTVKYKFDVSKEGKWMVKIGVIKNVGNQYQQNVISQFIDNLSLDSNIPIDTEYVISTIDIPEPAINYNQKTVNLVTQAAIDLYGSKKVNFIINSNSWYNNAIAYAASYVNSTAKNTKTISFIFNSVTDAKTFFVKDNDYLLFSYNIDWNFLDYTAETKIPDDLKVLATAAEKDNAYGINGSLIFIDGV